MGKGVGDEILGWRVLRQQGCAFVRHDHRHRVIQDGRPAIDLLLRREQGAIAQRRAANLGRDHFAQGVRRFHCIHQRLHQCGIGAIAHQQAKLTTGEIVGAVFDDAECVGWRQVGFGRDRSLGLFGQGQAKPVGDRVGKAVIDMHQMRQHARADVGPFHL